MASTHEFRKCPLCGFQHATLFLKATSGIPQSSRQIQVTDKFFGLHGDIVRCKRCGFTYVGRKMYVKKVVSLYRAMSDDVYVQEEKERRLSFINVLNTIGQIRFGKKGTLLDIGCCTGGLLAEAKKKEWKVWGVDPSLWACRMADRLHHLQVYNGTIELYKAPTSFFDVVTLLDVFEHVEYPVLLLEKIHSILKDDGILCIVTPNYGSITAKILNHRWWGIRLAHLSYFRDQDLETLFQKTGFQITKRKAYVRYFSLYYIFVRLFPVIDAIPIIQSFLKKITIPLMLLDTFELYLVKQKDKKFGR